MTVQQLSPEQLTELKQGYYANVLHCDIGVSYDELANINSLVSDEDVFNYYAPCEFVDADFFAS